MISTRDFLIVRHSVCFGATTTAQIIRISNPGTPSASNFCGRSNSDVMLGFFVGARLLRQQKLEQNQISF